MTLNSDYIVLSLDINLFILLVRYYRRALIDNGKIMRGIELKSCNNFIEGNNYEDRAWRRRLRCNVNRFQGTASEG